MLLHLHQLECSPTIMEFTTSPSTAAAAVAQQEGRKTSTELLLLYVYGARGRYDKYLCRRYQGQLLLVLHRCYLIIFTVSSDIELRPKRVFQERVKTRTSRSGQ